MSNGQIDPSERKALLIAAIPCLVVVAVLAVLQEPVVRVRTHVSTGRPVPAATPQQFYVEEPLVADLHGSQPVVPDNFKGINFQTRSYGPYKLSDGTRINLALKEGEHQVHEKNYAAWFSLKDVYYTDLTGDGKEEAIAMLSHVTCDSVGSCDGGTHLFYVYTVRNGKLGTLWQYETGSNAYGCGLKSLTVEGKKFLFELFGRCPKKGPIDSSEEKFITQDLTFMLFTFDGRRFVRQSVEIVPTVRQKVLNYKPSVNIYESPGVLEKDFKVTGIS